MSLLLQWMGAFFMVAQSGAAGMAGSATQTQRVAAGPETGFTMHLFLAYMVIWASIAFYLWLIASRQSELRRELHGLRAVTEEKSEKRES